MKLPRIDVGAQVGPYRLLSVLGQGAMGRVYQAERGPGGPRDALKLIGVPNFAVGDAGQISEIWERFKREVAVTRLLDHPHVTRLIDTGHFEFDGDDYPWLATELVDGARTLTEVYRNQPDPSWLLDRIGEILATLVHVHERDIIHRDIKPDNILISASGHLYVVDFGLVRVLYVEKERLTKTGQAMGTLQYMPLEQLGSAKEVDARADLYSVGMLLFELLENVQQWGPVLGDVLCGAGVTFHQPLPAPLMTFVRTLTEANRDNRYPSAAAAWTALSEVRRNTGW